jgi:hypothetical protein
MRKRKLTPEQRARYRELDRRAEQNLKRANEVLERAWAELHAKREASARGEIDLPPSWQPKPGEQ